MTWGASVPLSWKVWCRPKRGHTEAEYEDAAAGNPESGLFAIADGATESAFAGPWARSLVRSFVANAEAPDDWLGNARRWFHSQLQQPLLPWYLEEQARQGAHATFLGLRLTRQAPTCWAWHALAVGDCCLFHLRNRSLLQAFPLESSEQFHRFPALIDSNGDRLPSHRQTWGNAQSGDLFLLATDGVAQWLLDRYEKQPSTAVWTDLLLLDEEAGLERFFDDCQSKRNDDLTLVWIDLEPESRS